MAFPTIIVPGIGQSKTVLCDSGKTAWPLEVDTQVLKGIILPAAVRMMILRHDFGFEKALRRTIRTALEPLRCGKDGNPVNPVRVVTYETPISECSPEDHRYIGKMVPLSAFTKAVSEDNLFYFAYNPFGAADETVERLHAFVKLVKEKTGSEKVNLVSISLGGTVVTQYLDRYVEDGDIHKLVGIVSAFDGSRVVSGLFQKNVTPEKIRDLVVAFFSRKDAEAFDKVMSYVPKKLVPRYYDAVIDALRETLLLNCPMMWGAIPAKIYPGVRDELMPGEALRKRTDESYRVRSDFPALVEKCRKSGTEIYSLCGCGVPLIAVDDDTDSDMIVHVPSCMMADTLEESPIRDHVWFFEGMDHEGAAKQETLLSLCAELLTDDAITDVSADERYPQRTKA